MHSTPETETQPLTLAAFLAARLDEDAAEATKHPDGEDFYLPEPWSILATGETNYPCSPYLQIAKARVLAEVEVKRRIGTVHARLGDDSLFCVTCDAPSGIPGPPDGCATLRLLALPYAGHPDYKEGWRP